MGRFSDEEIRRYARQMVLPEVGGLGQARLGATRAQASSDVEALYLAGAGVGHLVVPSTEIADAVRALNPLVEVELGGALDDEDVEAASLRAVHTLLGMLEL
jgi:molybdopterin/thiamine biosynthesis adenylyltransferase